MKEELIVSLTADIKDLSSKLDKANSEIDGFANKSSVSTNKAASSFRGLGSELQNLVLGYIGLQAATEAVGRAFSESIKLDSVKSALTQVLGSAELAEAQLSRLSDSADYLGLNFLDLATSYKSFAAAAITSGQTLENVNKIFDSVTKSAAVLKLSSEDVKLALNALGQMFSKGSIQAEELRGQLGERLPGAVALLAKGLGVSTKQLNKMLEQGQVLASDLPKLAEQLDKTFGDSITQKVDSLQASVNTLSNTFTKSLSSGAVGNFFKVIVDGANRALTSVEYLYKVLTNPPGTNIKALGFIDDFKKYQELSKKGLGKIDPKSDQKKLATMQGEINSALEQNKKLTVDAIQLYGNQSAQVVTLNKEYGWLANQLKEVNKLIKTPITEPTAPTNRGYNPSLEMMQGAKEMKQIAEDLFKLYKESPESLKLLGEEYVSNPFFRDLVNGDLKKQTKETQEAFQKFLNTKRDDVSGGALPIDKEIEMANEQAKALVNTLGSGLTSAFDAAMTNGTNFFQELGVAILNMIKKLLAAIAVASILSAILGGFGVAASAVGKGTSLFGNILSGLTGGLLGGGNATGQRVATSVNTSSNNGTVAFEIRGDKLYGVLQNYQGRLDRLV